MSIESKGKEIDPGIHIDIPCQISLKSPRGQTLDPQKTDCLYSFLDTHSKLKGIEGNRP